ncbi:ABC transporter ATP-binding protein [Micromonospora saelicesensis]|uniref:ABC transporter ATP-binding protein n=1 Tax=Micromonospora saelicesensis TaxID=285676 RepID=UPI0021AC97D9|nr:ABC transporter ATP-binding protein [Micromonospora saelicesensis]
MSLTYSGPPPVEALRLATVSVPAGDYLTIVGRSGSGKSTLLNVIGLLDRPTAGVYRLDGIDTGELSDGELASLRARRIGFVFQSFHLMPHRTATENVGLALLYSGTSSATRMSVARDALDRVGLSHRLGALPTEMSGGERQRVAVARALAAQPSLLLCDEPTGNLDSESASVVLELIEELWRDGLTVLMITHDERIAGLGRRTVEIRDGQLTQPTATGERARPFEVQSRG